ncbi:MAG: sugar phosphate nucleotidyltransferase [Hyphomicrobium sp.]|uniref:sugar phosphate nucleotidyltransferase n=1 Tax=Hyphomicrobium sp. TaxID=82 RepID=UPI003D0AB487
MTAIFPVILSGGFGTRLWPLSRSMHPEQFIPFFNGRSILGAVLNRLKIEDRFQAPILLCNNDHRILIVEELDRLQIVPHAIILEPVARNTAAAIAIAALVATRENASAILAVSPSDHLIRNEARFVECVMGAARVAATGRLVLFGIKPTEPHTGYGCVRQGSAIEVFGSCAWKVDAFVEKPDTATAQSYLEQGGYYCNSGIYRARRAYLPRRARKPCAARSRGCQSRSCPRRGRSRRPETRQEVLRRLAFNLGRQCSDRTDGSRCYAADRRRVERCRFVDLAVGDCAIRRQQQLRAAKACLRTAGSAPRVRGTGAVLQWVCAGCRPFKSAPCGTLQKGAHSCWRQ